jgi:hypothetical protein
MTKTLLYVVLCTAALASGALFAQPGIGGGVTGSGNTTTTPPATDTPSTPSLPTNPNSPVSPDRSGTPTPGPDANSDFGKIDANADGQISRDEAKGNASLSTQFKKMDKNRDGSLSQDEYNASTSSKSSIKAKPSS